MGQKQSVSATTESSGATVINEDKNSSSSRQQQQHVAAIVEKQSNPFPEDEASHNFGQPTRPPHHQTPSVTTGDDKRGGASKMATDCRAEQRASLACIEENYDNKNVACVNQFMAYKRCRKEEHERKLDAARAAGVW